MFCIKEITLSSTKKAGKKGKRNASEWSKAIATVSAAKKKAAINMVGSGVISLPKQDRILSNLRVKAGDTKQPCVSSSTSAGRVFELDLEEEELD